MSTIKSYAAHDATAPLVPFTISRRSPGPTDVELDILYCGVCHSDLHPVFYSCWASINFWIWGAVRRTCWAIVLLRPS
jgi:D-arabinose 1-dehydrogenase-like Zn-dependent alcohol dehydrogenase